MKSFGRKRTLIRDNFFGFSVLGKLGQLVSVWKEKDLDFQMEIEVFYSSGRRIRTSDLRVMSPTSYQAALSRDQDVMVGD